MMSGQQFQKKMQNYRMLADSFCIEYRWIPHHVFSENSGILKFELELWEHFDNV